MHLDEFSVGTSFFHRLDPRVKFAVFTPLVFVVALSSNIWVGTLFLLLALICVFIARLAFKQILSRLLVVNVFVLFLWLTLPVSIKGTALFNIGPWQITAEGVVYSALITLKANAIFLLTIAILGTSEIFALVHALDHFRVPKRLLYLFFFFYRYITVLHQEYNGIRSAVKARGFVLKTNLHTWRTCAYMVGMLFVKSYERSKRIYQAMTLRGFRDYFPLITHFHIRTRDIVFVAIMYGIMGFCIAMNIFFL
jgi:cobalt/nickel transport system permease protein